MELEQQKQLKLALLEGMRRSNDEKAERLKVLLKKKNKNKKETISSKKRTVKPRKFE